MRPGDVVELDEVSATTGDRWTGFVLDTSRSLGSLTAVRAWRGKADVRTVDASRVVISYPGPSRVMDRTAADIAMAAAHGPRRAAVETAALAARLGELATLRRAEELAEARERNRELAEEFNAGMAERTSD